MHAAIRIALGMSIEALMPQILKMLSEHAGMMRGTITLLTRETGEIEIDSAYGLTEAERTRGRYRLGEGITGKVIESGIPAIVEKISQEPRLGAKNHNCLAICKTGAGVAGASWFSCFSLAKQIQKIRRRGSVFCRPAPADCAMNRLFL
jgi:hypothetical protein